MKTNGIVVIVRHKLLPGHEDQGKQELQNLVATVLREEPECDGIEMLQDVTDPTRITLIERWSTQEEFEGPHMQTAHIQSFIGRSNEFLEGPPDISFCRQVKS